MNDKIFARYPAPPKYIPYFASFPQPFGFSVPFVQNRVIRFAAAISY